ncbi:MAG: PAS domain S-box protein [Phycisphaerae bacterium]
MAPETPLPPPSEDAASLRWRVAQLEEELFLVERSYRRAQETTTLPSSGDVAALRQRVAQLEEQLSRGEQSSRGAEDITAASPADDAAALRRRVAQLEGELLLVERSYRRAVELTQQVGQALRDSEERYRAVVESAGEAIAVIDQSGKYLFINTTGAERLGRKVEQMVGRTVWDFFPKEAADYEAGIVREVIKSGRGQAVEVWIPTSRGKRFFRTTVQPLRSETGPSTAAMVIARDSTDQKLAEEESRKIDQWLQLILRHSQDGIVVTERDMKTRKRRLILCNDRYAQMAGRSREELMAADDLDVFVRIHKRPDEDAEDWEKVIRGEAIRGRASWIRPDGRENVYEWMAAPIRVQDRLYLLGIDRDITEQMRAEAALRESEQRYRDLFENAPLCVFECDGPLEARRILRANLAAQRRFGYSEAEFANMPMARIVPEGARGDIAAVFESLRQGKRVSIETPHICRDGSIFPSRLTATILPGTEPPRTIAMVEDITELKQAEKALLASERAERDLRLRLKAMNEVGTELSLAPSFDELCRQAVVLGTERLGFERLGLWFWQDGCFFGSFGTDERGNVRDERGSRGAEVFDEDRRDLVERRKHFIINRDCPLLNSVGEVVGKGTHITAALWDGQKVIGFFSADNLLRGREYTEADGEVLTLYAAVVARLCSRQRAEDALRESERAERRFGEQLVALHELANELTETSSFDELCRKAVEAGRTRLGFDRLGLWFITPRDGEMSGSYGTDEKGRTRDERTHVARLVDGLATTEIVRKKTRLAICEGAPLYDGERHIVGQGSHAAAALWDGRQIIGCLAADNLLTHRPFSHQDGVMLSLYATVLGHLCTQKRTGEAVQALHAQLMNAREEERRRLAKELHDSVGQRMIAMSLAIQNALDSMPKPPASISGLSRMCNEIVDEIRDACHGLYPPTLESLGLGPSLRQIAADLRPKMKMRVTIDPALARKRLGGEIEIALFRIAQEALSNAARHSGCTRASVRFARVNGCLSLVIQDNGRGFDPSAKARGLGISTMHERARAVGANLEVTSRPGRTRLVVTLPDPANDATSKSN